MTQVNYEAPAQYTVTPAVEGIAAEDRIIQQAIEILESRLTRRTTDIAITSPNDMRKQFFLRWGQEEREVFFVAFMNNRNIIIKTEPMFYGTINAASVWPREIAKEALRCNASAIVIGHNHPSGDAEPSQADKNLTKRIVEACNLFDIRVIDHIVLGETLAGSVSFAEIGLI